MPISLALPARALWQQLAPERDFYLERGQDVASLTIPYLAPPGEQHEHTDFRGRTLPTPYQSVGSRGVNNIAAKFLLSLLPPATPFFRLGLDYYTFTSRFGTEQIGDAEAGLVEMENAVHGEIEAMGLRPVAYQAFRHLVVTGNGIIHMPNKGRPKFMPMKRYVVKRDPDDNLLLLLFKESVNFSVLPKNVQRAVAAEADMSHAVQSQDITQRNITIYSRVQRMTNGRFAGWQELENGARIPGTQGAWDEEELPWIVLRWNRIDGEDYGRGLGEEELGDLRSLEGLSQAIVDGAAAASHHIWLVNPNGRTRIRDVSGAPTGAFRVGNADDLSAMRLDKGADFAFATGVIQDLERRLKHAFLLVEGVQRNAERVTAEEIRTLTAELQENLGGVFSVQSEEFQLPIVKRTMRRMESRGALPPTPRGLVTPKIVTGLEGLGRNQENNRLRIAATDIQGTLGEAGMATLNMREWAERFITGAGVTPEGLIYTEEEIQAQQQAAQMAALAERAAPQAMSAAGKMVTDAG